MNEAIQRGPMTPPTERAADLARAGLEAIIRQPKADHRQPIGPGWIVAEHMREIAAATYREIFTAGDPPTEKTKSTD